MSYASPLKVLPSVRVKRIDSGGIVEVIVEVAPTSTGEDLVAQFASLITNARQALIAQGLGPTNIVAGWIHFAEAPGWNWREALASAWDVNGPLPLTAVLQPPAQPFCRCTMQLHAMRTARQSGVWYGNSPSPAAATVLRSGARHLRLMSVLPRPEVRGTDVADLAYDMFAQARHALIDRGLSFSDVVRTWIYVRDIAPNYAAFEQGRDRFLHEQGLERLPASTCVQGVLIDGSASLAMDLYAIAAHPSVAVSALMPGGSGERAIDASYFVGSVAVVEPGRRSLYVAGTASPVAPATLTASDEVVAPGDLQGQLDGVFRNVRSLLDQSGMTFADGMSTKAYLKHARDYPTFCEAARSHGIADDVPSTVVVAAPGHPGCLCEIELWFSQTL
jgi:enamine deaminase RidA (YjgF/YER057c/UK114 family)